ncbi:MAG TPA: hypothetical protein VK453_25745 [Micromonosporaceae bacterium]|nr:hypothetical protein [Micromonosporaceae bacterium]
MTDTTNQTAADGAAEEPEAAPTGAVDLMAALRASVERARAAREIRTQAMTAGLNAAAKETGR